MSMLRVFCMMSLLLATLKGYGQEGYGAVYAALDSLQAKSEWLIRNIPTVTGCDVIKAAIPAGKRDADQAMSDVKFFIKEHESLIFSVKSVKIKLDTTNLDKISPKPSKGFVTIVWTLSGFKYNDTTPCLREDVGGKFCGRFVYEIASDRGMVLSEIYGDEQANSEIFEEIVKFKKENSSKKLFSNVCLPSSIYHQWHVQTLGGSQWTTFGGRSGLDSGDSLTANWRKTSLSYAFAIELYKGRDWEWQDDIRKFRITPGVGIAFSTWSAEMTNGRAYAERPGIDPNNNAVTYLLKGSELTELLTVKTLQFPLMARMTLMDLKNDFKKWAVLKRDSVFGYSYNSRLRLASFIYAGLVPGFSTSSLSYQGATSCAGRYDQTIYNIPEMGDANPHAQSRLKEYGYSSGDLVSGNLDHVIAGFSLHGLVGAGFNYRIFKDVDREAERLRQKDLATALVAMDSAALAKLRAQRLEGDLLGLRSGPFNTLDIVFRVYANVPLLNSSLRDKSSVFSFTENSKEETKVYRPFITALPTIAPSMLGVQIGIAYGFGKNKE